MSDNLSVEQRILCSQLENYSPEIKTAYLGAIHTLHTEDYDDRLVHFAHSLREVIDLLTRKNQTDDERRTLLRKEDRISHLASVIDPAGKQVYEFDFLYKQLLREYDDLSEFAHHRFKLEQKNAEEKLVTVEEILSRLTKPQTEILDEIDEVISSGPSKDSAEKLKSYLFRWSSHSYLLDKLPCDWLRFLDEAGFFDNPQPMPSPKKQRSGTFPYWMPSGYLTKCVSSIPEAVTKIILKCQFNTTEERNPAIYDDFLKCALELKINDMEEIAQKAIDEKWHDFVHHYFIAEKYTDLAEHLYLEGKYDIALQMLSHFLDPAKIGTSWHHHNYDIEKILNEKTPRLAEKNPLAIAKLLASFIEELVKQDTGSKSYDSSYTLLSSIEDHEQNRYLMHHVSAICLVNLRNCLLRLGNTNPRELKANMNILSDRKFYIFRRIEIFLYEKFPVLFRDEISKSLIEFFGVYQVHHEYYHLLKSMFGSMDELIQKKILDLIKTKSQEIFDECKKERDEEYATTERDAWLLRKLEPIHDYLEGKDKEQYEKLIQEFGTSPHPDFDHYVEVSIGKSASEPEFFSDKTIDEVFDIMKQYKSTSGTMPYEDKTIASFGDYVRDNPLEYSKKSTEIEGLDSKIQYTFLSAIEDSVNTKKDIDWNPVIALIERYVSSASSNLTSSSMFDPMLESYRIMEKGLKENQIDFNLKDRVWNLVQRFIEFSNKTDVTETEYPNNNTDSLTISINNTDGLSFHILFRYVWWCHHHEKSKDIFNDDIKKILEDYVNKKTGSHTISRHSAVGLYVPTMLYFDTEWTDEKILSKIFSSKSNKIAFWDSFVSFNRVQTNTLLHLHGLYDEFLNGSISHNIHEKNFYHSTIEHVTLGYFYGITNFDKIFDDFISKAEPSSINHCGFFITRILSQNPDVSKFKDKIIRLWKEQKFIDFADMDMWFKQSSIDKKETIELFLHYMQQCTKKFNSIHYPFDELSKYVSDFPDEVAQCIEIFLDKLGDSYHLPTILKSILKDLLAKNIDSVNNTCKKIIEKLVGYGYNDYKDLL